MNNSKLNSLDNLYPYVLSLMQKEGRNFDICELCKQETRGNFEIHHTKYNGATYYDLRIVCRSCNKKPENIGLS